MNSLNAYPEDVGASTRILIADPDDDTRGLYRESLRAWDCDVLEANDGRDALAKAFVRPLDAVVTELRLPLLDGYALMDILRHDRATRSVPILIVTSEARVAELQRARSLGADEVLVKPLGIEVLLKKLRDLVEVSRSLISASRDEIERTRGLIGRAAEAIDRSAQMGKRVRLPARALSLREAPAAPAPALKCPECDRPLTHRSSHVGGTSERNMEQWDYFECPRSCGRFQYRHRTRKLRKIS